MIGRVLSAVVTPFVDVLYGWRRASLDEVVRQHVAGKVTNPILGGTVNELMTETNYLQRRMRKALFEGDYDVLEAMRTHLPKIRPTPDELQNAYMQHMGEGRKDLAEKIVDLYEEAPAD